VKSLVQREHRRQYRNWRLVRRWLLRAVRHVDAYDQAHRAHADDR
jgi:hypothetical protein